MSLRSTSLAALPHRPDRGAIPCGPAALPTVLLLLLIAAIISPVHSTANSSSRGSDTQCTFLVALYIRSSNPGAWRNASGWSAFATAPATASPSSPPSSNSSSSNTTSTMDLLPPVCCAWFGVTCDSAHHVRAIALAGNNIAASAIFPLDWANLPFLESVDVSRNQFAGPLQAAFAATVSGAAPSLRRLVLHSNQMTGTLPGEWTTRLPALEFLDAAYNTLHGTIPAAWAGMASLRMLTLANNRLAGPIPPLRACSVNVNANAGINGTLQNLPWSVFASNNCSASGGFALSVFTTAVSGTVPCVPNVTRLELGYTHVHGAVPCCGGSGDASPATDFTLTYLGAEGTLLDTWDPACSGSVNTSSISPNPLLYLYLADTKLTYVPLAIAQMYPRLKHLSLRNLNLAHRLPALPPSLTVLDAAENRFTAQSAPLVIPPDFQMVDLSTTSSTGLTVKAINYSCSAGSPAACLYGTGVFTALGAQNVDGGWGDASTVRSLAEPLLQGLSTDTVVDPALALLPSRELLVLTAPYDFLSVRFSGMFKPMLFALGALDGSRLPPTLRSVPVPSWNNTHIAIPAAPSTILVFNGLVDASLLLFGVAYSLDVEFLFRSAHVSNASVGSSSSVGGAVTRTLAAGRVLPPLCNPSLLGVPFTRLCAGCPAHGVCNGSSACGAMDGFWRPSGAVLPFYPCPVKQGCSGDGAAQGGAGCAIGYAGPLCGACSAGFGRDSANLCVTCSSDAWNVAVVVVGSLVLLAIATFIAINAVEGPATSAAKTLQDDAGSSSAAWWQRLLAMSQSSRLLAVTAAKKIQSHMGLYTLVGRLALLNNRAPAFRVLQALQQVASQFSLRSISFVTCLFPHFSVITQFQVLLAVVPCLLVGEVVVVRKVRGQWAVFAVVSALCTFIYDMSINIALLLIPIDAYTFYDVTQFLVNRTQAVPHTVVEMLSTDHGVAMAPSFAAHHAWRTVAFVFLAVFGVGFPVAITALLRHYRNSQPQAMVTETFGFLTSTYRPAMWYWEQVVLGRKLALACVVIGLLPYPMAQAQGMLVVLLTYVILMEATAPFASSVMHTAERCTCGGGVLLVNLVMGFAAAEDETSASASGDLAVVNVIVQYLALLLLLLLLSVEWKNRQQQQGADASDGDTNAALSPTQFPTGTAFEQAVFHRIQSRRQSTTSKTAADATSADMEMVLQLPVLRTAPPQAPLAFHGPAAAAQPHGTAAEQQQSYVAKYLPRGAMAAATAESSPPHLPLKQQPITTTFDDIFFSMSLHEHHDGTNGRGGGSNAFAAPNSGGSTGTTHRQPRGSVEDPLDVVLRSLPTTTISSSSSPAPMPNAYDPPPAATTGSPRPRAVVAAAQPASGLQMTAGERSMGWGRVNQRIDDILDSKS